MNDADHTPTIDDRERRSAVPDALAATSAFDIDFCRPPVGDYRLDNALLFERKTLVELVASIKAGRLFSQTLLQRSRHLEAAS